MKRIFYCLYIICFIFIIFGDTTAQQSNENSWNSIITFNYGYIPGSENWEYSHPLYTGQGTQTIRETGSFNAKSVLSCGFEYSKKYFGFKANAGIIPAEIKIDKSQDSYVFNSFFLEIEGIFFPTGNQPDNINPLLKIGFGGITSSGDLNNTALVYSFGGGARTCISEKFFISLVIKARHFSYDEIPLDNNVTGDISFTNFAAEIEFLYLL